MIFLLIYECLNQYFIGVVRREKSFSPSAKSHASALPFHFLFFVPRTSGICCVLSQLRTEYELNFHKLFYYKPSKQST